MEQLFEIHLTMCGDEKINREAVEAKPGWKFSKIDGDPVLGDGVKQYATRHLYFSGDYAQFEAKKSAMYMRRYLETFGIKVLRDKVELIVHDNKTP